MTRGPSLVVCATLTAAWLLSVGATPARAQDADRELGRISSVEGRELAAVGFELGEPGAVEIEATVLRGSQVEGRTGVWILDATSREVAWTPGEVESLERSRFLDRWVERVRLGSGRYELYYAAALGSAEPSEDNAGLLDSLVREVVGFSAPPEAVAELGVTVRGRGTSVELTDPATHRPPGAVDLVTLVSRGDDVLEERAFELVEPATLEIYSVGEVGEDTWADWGWLVEVDSRRVLWELAWDNSRPGGGWEGNRRAKERIALPPGMYAIGFQSDRGHSSAGWSAAPPFDPSAWGIRALCVEGPGCASAREVSWERLPAALEIARLTGVGDGERRALPFRLDYATRLRVYAVGEGTNRRLWDHGWIERTDDGERVWSMETGPLRPAGGSSKNIRIDEVVELAPGDYRAVFECDDSHSAGSGWNAAAPIEADRWGITLLAPGSGLAPR